MPLLPWYREMLDPAEVCGDAWVARIKAEHAAKGTNCPCGNHNRPTHAEHAAKVGLATPCTAWHVNFGGGCLNCGWKD